VAGQAKVRGATSAGYPKQSYTLKFDDEELGVEEWGHKTRGHMVLITTFDDASYLRQKLVYDLYRAMADHQGVQRLVPRTFFAVVYLNGVYQGLYVGCDRIDDELARHSGFADGEGNLYKAVSHDANLRLTGAGRGGRSPKRSLHAGYDKAEGPPGDFSDLDRLVAAIGGASDADIAAGRAGMPNGIDIAEFMDWYILVGYAAAGDSAGKNSYLYHATPKDGRRRR
jgi:spore coat protein CotH